LFAHSAQKDIFRRRIAAGQTIFAIWAGLDNGIASADMEPYALAPSNAAQLNWPLWGVFVETKGRQGEPVALPEAQELVELLEKWRSSKTKEERTAIWGRMLAINADQ